MKKCPKCNRTYADDGFTFCLEDGALLSAAYDPDNTESVRPKTEEPPPTVVLPAARDAATENSARDRQAHMSTIAGPPPLLAPAVSSAPAPTSSKLFYVLPVGIVVILGIGVLMFLSYRRGQCPKISVDCNQIASDVYCTLVEDHTSRTYSEVGPALASLRVVLGLQRASTPPHVSNITWSSSAGRLVNREGASAAIDTTGLSGKEITVTANYTTDGFICTNHSSAKVVVEIPNH